MRVMRTAIAALMCMTLLPALALAQDEAFKKGLQARGDKNWPEAARQMRSAIQSDGQESTRKVRSNLLGVFGAGGVEYLPHYFLGEALKNQQQQDCAGAVTAWSTSLDQRIVQTKVDFYQNLQRGLKECAAKGVLLQPEYDVQLKNSRQAYDDARALAKKVTDLGAAHREQWLPLAAQYEAPRRELETANVRLNTAMRTRSAADFTEVRSASDRATALLRPLEDALSAAIDNVASLQEKIRNVEQAIGDAEKDDKSIDGIKVALSDSMAATRRSGREQLAQARTQLTAGQKTQNGATVNDAMKYAQSAAGSFSQVIDQLRKVARGVLDQQLGEAVRLADEAFASVSALMETWNRRAAQKPDKVTPEMTTQRDALQKQIETQRRRYDRVRKAEDVAGLGDVTKQTLSAQAALDQLIQAFGPLTLADRGVHAALQDGARLFFEGEYQQALTALDPSSGVGDAPMQLHVHLFRAAALYGLFVRSGETRQDLRTQALAEIELCKQISSTFEPDARFFAPRFITLYKTGGAAASQTASATTQQ